MEESFKEERKGPLVTPLLLTLLIFFSLVLTMPVSGEKNESLLIAMYASGNTLEQEYGWITADFKEIIAGAGDVSPDQLNVIIGFGGADKPGWHGLTITDLHTLSAAGDDAGLPDKSRALYYLPDANMGDSETLTLFIRYIYENFQFDRIYLIFIGHGEAYTGMLFDQNHKDDPLTTHELITALEEGAWDFDLIGFDSCLMSCLEVASALSLYSPYMIASQESAPAEGWEYETWIRYLVENPGSPVPEHARVLFDGYMKNPEPGKTIALLDLKQTGYLTAQLERFGRDLESLLTTEEGFLAVQAAVIATQQFGLTDQGDLEPVTMDLYDFTIKMKDSVSYLEESADGVIEGIDRTVIFARHDEYVPDAHGIAVLSPLLINPAFYSYYRNGAFITPSWDRFLIQYLEKEYEDELSIISSY